MSIDAFISGVFHVALGLVFFVVTMLPVKRLLVKPNEGMGGKSAAGRSEQDCFVIVPCAVLGLVKHFQRLG